MTVQQLYEQTIKPLPMADRYRLAVLILHDIPRRRWWMPATPGRRRICASSLRRVGRRSTCVWRQTNVPDPGDVVTVDFVGATGIKRRPAVVGSSGLYHQHRPDRIRGC